MPDETTEVDAGAVDPGAPAGEMGDTLPREAPAEEAPAHLDADSDADGSDDDADPPPAPTADPDTAGGEAAPLIDADPEPEPAPIPAAEIAQVEPAQPEEASASATSPAEAAPPDPVPAEPAAPVDQLDSVLISLERLHLRLDELSRLSERQMGHIDQLHAENQQLRAGELRQAMSPMLRSLVRHHDNVAKMEESVVDNDGESHALRDVRAGLLNVLSIAGVESFDVGPDEPFDASRHQGVGRTDTDDVALDGTVARMRRCGFVSDDGRIVRAAEVEVYRAR